MIKRLCPVCDGEIRAGHFCPGCRQWIREPKVMDVRYYLNERHPKGETDCLYHNEMKEILKHPREQEGAVKKHSAGRKTARPTKGTQAAASARKQTGKGYHAVAIVVILYLVIMFFAPLMGLLFSVLESLFAFL